VRLAVQVRRGVVLATLRDEAPPPLCSPHVHIVSSRLDYELVPSLGDLSARDAYDVGDAVPTTSLDAVPKRVAEHVAGRYLAARALLSAGHSREPRVSVGIEGDRAPAWPAGFVGSITHGGELALAAVARTGTTSALGIDVEPVIEPKRMSHVSEKICAPAELEALVRAGAGLSPAEVFTIVFSAKESLYKALYPRVRRYFGFPDAEGYALDVARGTMRLRLLTDLEGPFRRGWDVLARFVLTSSHVVTAVELSQEAELLR
jgi:enterobactin synthetase component D